MVFLPPLYSRAAELMQPLYKALKDKANKQVVDWTEERERVFVDGKMVLADATMLAHPSPKAPFAITTDASDVVCQLAKVYRHIKEPLAQFSAPERRFDHVNVDLVCPLPPSPHNGRPNHSLPEALPLSSTMVDEVAQAIFSTWVAS